MRLSSKKTMSYTFTLDEELVDFFKKKYPAKIRNRLLKEAVEKSLYLTLDQPTIIRMISDKKIEIKKLQEDIEQLSNILQRYSEPKEESNTTV